MFALQQRVKSLMFLDGRFLTKQFAMGKGIAYGKILHVNYHFHLIGHGKQDVDRTEDRTKHWECTPIEGTCQKHFIITMGFIDGIRLSCL